MKKHCASTSRIWKQRYEATQSISEQVKFDKVMLTEKEIKLKRALIAIHTTASLAGSEPSEQTMIDIINFVNEVL